MIFELIKIAFWVSVAALVYVYVGYPLCLAVISMFRRRRPAEPDYEPRITVMIAAHNEEAGIEQKIQQTLALDYPADKFDILVVSDGSTDRTDELVSRIAATDARVRLLRTRERRGKTNAQNEGIEKCTGDVVVFSDATTVYHPKALRYLAANYINENVGAASGRYQYFDPTGDSPTGLGTIAFWNYENFIKTMQSRIATISGCCGCIYSVRRKLYTALADDVISDLVQPLYVIKQGYRVAFEDRALAYEETTSSSEEEFRMRVRVVTRGMRGILSVPDVLNPFRRPWLAFQLLSHKVMRWLVPLFLVVAFLTSAALWGSPLYRWIFLLQAGFYAWAALIAIVPPIAKIKALAIPLYFCTVNAAAVVSMVQLIRGQRYVVWQPVRQAAQKS